MKRRVVIDVLFRALLCFVCIKVFELVTLIETENTLPIIGIDYKKTASCLIVFFDEPRFEIADNLLAYMIITSLIFCVYTKAANKYCYFGCLMTMLRERSIILRMDSFNSCGTVGCTPCRSLASASALKRSAAIPVSTGMGLIAMAIIS